MDDDSRSLSSRCCRRDFFQRLRFITEDTRIIVRRPPAKSQPEQLYPDEIAKGLNLPLRRRRLDPSKGVRNIFVRWRVSTANTKEISAREASEEEKEEKKEEERAALIR